LITPNVKQEVEAAGAPAHAFRSSIGDKVKNSIKRLLPRDLVNCISIFRKRTYIEDGLMTMHVADFCEDREFISAYEKGRATGSWNGEDLRWRVYTACWAAKQASVLFGDFVECGVNRGGISLAVMEYIDFNLLNKSFFLLDTYCGFSENQQVNASVANLNSYQDCYQDVLSTFASFHGARIIAGSIPETLEQVETEGVCYLSIDMNCTEPEIAAMKFFWRKLVPGAVVLLDDYAFSEPYRPQKQAFDSLAKELGFEILSLPTGQGMIVKR
jgi:O-methyltransferase